jgi:tRNA-modifying protein YgfZ
MGSGVTGRGLATLRLDRVEEALAGGATLVAGGITLQLLKASWARFAIPGKAKAAE